MKLSILGLLFLSICGIAMASPDDGGGKPAARPSTSKPSSPSPAPVDSLPESSNGVPNVAAAMPNPNPVPATPPPTRPPGVRRPEDFFDSSVPDALDIGDGPGQRFTFATWSHDNLGPNVPVGSKNFMDLLAENGMYETLLQLLEAVGLPTAYETFAEDYIARQVAPRREKMKDRYKKALALEEVEFERYLEERGVTKTAARHHWTSVSKDIKASWDKKVAKSEATFRRESTASYKKIMGGATVVCAVAAAAAAKGEKRKNDGENGGTSKKPKKNGASKKQKKKMVWDSDEEEGQEG